MSILVADIEADGLLDTVANIWQISIIDYDTKEAFSYNDQGSHGTIAEGLERMRVNLDPVVWHNGLGYDLWAIKKVLGTVLDWRKVIDTLTLSRLGNPVRPGGHSLANWGEILGYPKVVHEDWSKWSPEMEQRCAVDTEITLKVFDRLKGMLDVMPEAVAIEHQVHWMVTECVQRGFKLDTSRAMRLLQELQLEQEKVAEQFTDLFPPILVPTNAAKPTKCLKVVNKGHALYGALEAGIDYSPLVVQEFNPASRQQIASRLTKKYGWKASKFTPGGSPEISEEVLRELDYPEAQVFADYLKADKLISQINSEPKKNGSGGGWLHHVKPDGRVHAGLQPLKAITGRLACASPNVQQASTDPRMRACWVPSEGFVLVGVDAEGLELRCLSHYLAPLDNGAYRTILLDGDIHTHVQKLLGFHSRQEVKRVEYGWLYGAGDLKLGRITQQDAQRAGLPIQYKVLGLKDNASLMQVGKAVRRRMVEGILGLDSLSKGVKLRAKEFGKMRGLDGRPLWIRYQHAALNMLLQSAGIIVCKKAWCLMDEEITALGVSKDDYGLVMQIHDEFQFEARPEVAELVAQGAKNAIVRAGVELKFRCPLSGSSSIGTNWSETH